VRVQDAIAEMEKNPRHVRFARCKAICEQFFGKPRKKGSHFIFQMQWPGDPRINIQNRGSFVAEYQIRQVIAALKRLEDSTL